MDDVRYEECLDDVDPSRIYVAQKTSATFGGRGSSSEVLNNPRLFVWNASKNLLFMPVELSWHDDEFEEYRITDAFFGTLAVSVTPARIAEEARITHFDSADFKQKREEECLEYSERATRETQCVEIIGGGTYCPDKTDYIPPYCYADAPIETYIAQQRWQYRQYMVTRNLYFDDTLFVVSDDHMTLHDMDDDYERVDALEWKQ